MRRTLFALVILLSIASLASATVTAWSGLSIRSPSYQFSRGTTTFNVYDTGMVSHAITVQRWITSGNGRIRAFPAGYTGADTTGQGVDCVYETFRNGWYVPNPSFTAYRFYEIGGAGADSLCATPDGVPIVGKTAPDTTFVPTIRRSAIPVTFGPGGSSSQTIQGYLIATAVQTSAITPKTGGTVTPNAMWNRVPIIQPEARGDTMSIGPRTGTAATHLLIEDRTLSNYWLDFSPQGLTSSPFRFYLGGAEGTANQLLAAGSSGACGWVSSPTVTNLTATGKVSCAGNLGVGTNAAQTFIRLRDGSNNHLDIAVSPQSANQRLFLNPALAVGTYLASNAVTDSTVTQTAKRVWSGRYTFADDAATSMDVTITGVVAGDVVLVTPETNTTLRWSAIAGTDKISIGKSAAGATDYVVDYIVIKQ